MSLMEINYAVIEAIQSVSFPLLDQLMLLVTFLGNPALWIFVAALVYWQGREKQSFFLMNVIAFSGALVSMLKLFFMVPRPSPEEVRVVSGEFISNYATPRFDYSFPSGHTTLITSIYFHLGSFIKKNSKLVLLVVMLLVAFSRMYLGMHFITDILAGIILGFFIGKVNFSLMKRWEKAHFKLTKLEDEIGLVITLIIVLIVLALFNLPGLAMVIFGYYAGFFLFKEQGLDSTLLKGRDLWLKELIGVVILTVLAFPAIYLNPAVEISLVLFFLCGFWISFVYPSIYEKILKKRTA